MEIYVILIIVAVIFITISAILKRYKRCPSDKILVIYGKTGRHGSSKCVHGGAAFIWPVFQNYAFLDLTPISIESVDPAAYCTAFQRKDGTGGGSGGGYVLDNAFPIGSLGVIYVFLVQLDTTALLVTFVGFGGAPPFHGDIQGNVVLDVSHK